MPFNFKESCTREEAIEYLKEIGAPDLNNERVILTQFLSTHPTLEQIWLVTTMIINAKEENKEKK